MSKNKDWLAQDQFNEANQSLFLLIKLTLSQPVFVLTH